MSAAQKSAYARNPRPPQPAERIARRIAAIRATFALRRAEWLDQDEQ